MVNYKMIGKRVKELRQQQGLSQTQLAEMAGLSLSYEARIERGQKKASLGSIIGIADALGITTDELLCGNQKCDPCEYQTDMDVLMADCSSREKRFIYVMVRSLKEAAREYLDVPCEDGPALPDGI